MKKLLAIVLSALVILSAVGCSKQKDIDFEALGAELKQSNLFVDQLEPVNEKVLSSMMKLDTTLIESFECYAGTGYTGEEYGLFICNSAEDAAALETQLKTRTEDLYNTYESYAEDALPRISNAVIRRSGQYVVYVIADDYSSAVKIVDNYYS